MIEFITAHPWMAFMVIIALFAIEEIGVAAFGGRRRRPEEK